MLTFLVALPLGITLRGMLGEHLGASLAARDAASGVNYDWWQEFSAQATGVGVSFSPTILGFGAVLANLGAMADNRSQAPAIAAAGTAYVVLWILLAGGIIDRYARNRPTRASGFFSACGVFFFRFLRLGIVALFLLLASLRLRPPGPLRRRLPLAHPRRHGRAQRVCRQDCCSTSSSASCSSPATWSFDYAKIRAVVEDRRSMIGALLGAVRFVARHPGRVAGLYLLNGALFLLVIFVYAIVAPGAGGSGWSLLGRPACVGDLPARPPVGEAAVLRVADGALPGHDGSRRVHRGADAGVARLAGRGSHRPAAGCVAAAPSLACAQVARYSRTMSSTADRLVGWLKTRLDVAGARGFVVGLSGGLDSTVVARLCQAAAPGHTLGVILPCHSAADDAADALRVAEHFHLPAMSMPLDATYDTLVADLDVALREAATRDVRSRRRGRRRGRCGAAERGARAARAGQRQAAPAHDALYYVANRLNYLVAGTGNRAELVIGYFTKYGDGGVDLLPLGNLVKSEVRALARELGVPASIIDKPPSAGLWLGQTDEGEMGFTYADLEAYLRDGPRAVAPAVAVKIERLARASDHKRALPPTPDEA